MRRQFSRKGHRSEEKFQAKSDCIPRPKPENLCPARPNFLGKYRIGEKTSRSAPRCGRNILGLNSRAIAELMKNRNEAIKAIDGKAFDVCVIGGGATGAG